MANDENSFPKLCEELKTKVLELKQALLRENKDESYFLSKVLEEADQAIDSLQENITAIRVLLDAFHSYKQLPVAFRKILEKPDHEENGEVKKRKRASLPVSPGQEVGEKEDGQTEATLLASPANNGPSESQDCLSAESISFTPASKRHAGDKAASRNEATNHDNEEDDEDDKTSRTKGESVSDTDSESADHPGTSKPKSPEKFTIYGDKELFRGVWRDQWEGGPYDPRFKKATLTMLRNFFLAPQTVPNPVGYMEAFWDYWSADDYKERYFMGIQRRNRAGWKDKFTAWARLRDEMEVYRMEVSKILGATTTPNALSFDLYLFIDQLICLTLGKFPRMHYRVFVSASHPTWTQEKREDKIKSYKKRVQRQVRKFEERSCLFAPVISGYKRYMIQLLELEEEIVDFM